MSHIIAICNQKGGVGKTTTAINLSACLAQHGRRVLLIDMDPQGNATSGLGVDKTQLTHSIYHVMLGETKCEQPIQDTEVKKLSLLPSSTDLIGAEVELVNRHEREFILRAALQPIDETFDFIFIDCPPSLGLLTINALAAASKVIIPVQCEFYALEGLTQLIHTIGVVKNNLNPTLAIDGLLLTMADYRTNLTREVISEVRGFAKERIFQTVIPRSIRLSEAPSYGKPILSYDRESIGAKHYAELAQEVLGSLERVQIQC